MLDVKRTICSEKRVECLSEHVDSPGDSFPTRPPILEHDLHLGPVVEVDLEPRIAFAHISRDQLRRALYSKGNKEPTTEQLRENESVVESDRHAAAGERMPHV
jgi:hypothetical protein